MPKPTPMGLRWVLAAVAALVAGGTWCASARAIVGGTAVPIDEHPYQVALVVAGTAAAADPPEGQYCGGSVRDSLHVITAAHCVFNTSGDGSALKPSQIDVLAGAADLRTEAQGQRVHVSAISFDPDYDQQHQFANDAAVLTLAEALQPSTAVQPLSLTNGTTVQTGDPLFVTGWGALQYGGGPQYVLHGATVDYYSYDDCLDNPDFFVSIEPGQFCASIPGQTDACQGDSGGPAVNANATAADPSDDTLVGIVSSGRDCGKAHYPGIYTDVAYPDIKTFLTQPNPPPSPAKEADPTLSGVPAIGQQLVCSPGTWSGSPSFSYTFVRSVGPVDVGVAASGSSAYTVTAADAGTALRCDVTARNSGGAVIASSAPTAVIAGPPSTTPPTPQQPQPSLDLYAPVARITKVRCTLTRCTLSVSVRDVGYSAGIKTVQASVRSTYRSTCRRKGHRVACTKHKASKPKVRALGATTFQVVASKLPVGKQLFTLVAIDVAGHRQALPTRKTVTTKRSKKRR